jgi:23S rRNA (cytidine1920-2'-O)/16S rRNA (cytidine1409-2'-O)-methyltransferase
MPRVRLDTLLVTRGLAASRERARALVLGGRVRLPNVPNPKPGALVDDNAEIDLVEPDHPYVGRGGLKLAHALDTFDISVAGRTALDIGASTGGFTDVLLRRGAKTVVALDVGHGQLDWRLRQDPRVVVLERVNARTLTPDALPDGHRRFDVIAIDVSFISLRYIVPTLPPLVLPDGDIVALVKPQFEAGRADVGRGGIVRDQTIRARVVDDVAVAAAAVGLERVAVAPSPIEGVEGNVEIFVHFRVPGRARS